MDSVHAHQLASDLLDALQDPSRNHAVTVTQVQLDALERLVNHGVGTIRPRFEIGKNGAVADITIDLGQKGYLNLSAHVRESRNGFPPLALRIGSVRVPSKVTRWLLNRSVTALDLPPTPEARLDRFITRFVVSRPGQAVVNIQPDPELFEGLKAMAPHFSTSVDPALVRFYYNSLLDRDLRSGVGAKSFATFVNTTFRIVVQRSERRDPAAETRAALVALSMITLGPDAKNLARMVAPFDAPCVPEPSLFTLAGRTDLPKHFSLSAALSILFADRFSRAAGEWKELSDSAASGGTGFSFVDLMADRAGLRLGMAANGDLSLLREVQYGLAYVGDERLLPVAALRRLREGLSYKAFEEQYVSINDERYRQMIAQIDEELDRIPLYKATPKPDIG
ncbi:hypothetical protein [Pedomonas sp. V897]|uniref:hypothetical protein n=1 Tax=Pedomonas sp. V897 TaxID=3446482 RepID=UPI003EE2D639